MDKVRISKQEALDVLRKNRNQHRIIFLEAVEGYKTTATNLLEEHIKQIKKGKCPIVSINLPQPSDHTKDYDTAIKMLEMSLDSEVFFDDDTFTRYIMDDWSWKRQFLASNSAYSATASAFFNQMG